MDDQRTTISKFIFNVEIPVQMKKSWNFRKVDWAGFTQHPEIICNNTNFHSNIAEEQFRVIKIISTLQPTSSFQEE